MKKEVTLVILMRIFLLIPFWLLFFQTTPTIAIELDSLIEEMAEDFRPVLGHLITIKKTIHIDVGSKEGVRLGDLFRVFIPSGQIDVDGKRKCFKRTQAGTLLVEKVEESRSVCSVLKQMRPFPKGSEVERYSGLRAAILGLGRGIPPESMSLAMNLKKRLWWFDWVEDETLPETFDAMEDLRRHQLDIAFVLSKHGVFVYRTPKILIKSYSIRMNSSEAPMEERYTKAPFWRLTEMEKVAELPDLAKQVEIRDCNGDGLLEVYTLLGNELFFDKWGDNTPRRIRVYSEPYWETISFSLSCRESLLAINNVEEGVGLHSSLVFFDGTDPDCQGKALVTDVNLWLKFSDSGGPGGEMKLWGEGYFSMGADRGEKRLFLLAPDRLGGLDYLDEIEVPAKFSFKNGQVMGHYLFFKDEGTHLVVLAISGREVVWRKEIDLRKLKDAILLFPTSIPFNFNNLNNSLLVPVYFPVNNTSKLYLLDLHNMRLNKASEPLDGKMIGLDLVKNRLYIAVRDEKGETTTIFAISID